MSTEHAVLNHERLNYMGLRCYVVPPHAKMRLRDEVPVSDKFREAFNLWLIGFFGMADNPLVANGVVLINEKAGGAFMSQATYQELRRYLPYLGWQV